MAPTDELLSDDDVLGGLDVMVDIGDQIPDDHIGFRKTRVAFLEAYADWIDIMRATSTSTPAPQRSLRRWGSNARIDRLQVPIPGRVPTSAGSVP